MTKSRLKMVIINVKVDVEKFDGWNNFDLCHSDMKDALYMLDFDMVLKETRPNDTRESDLGKTQHKNLWVDSLLSS